MIAFSKNKEAFGWLSNTSAFQLTFELLYWNTSEALFQALRFEDKGIREQIRAEKSPMRAKFIAKAYREKMVVVPASEQDVANMEMVLRLKLEQHPQLAEFLARTGNEEIIEDVTSRAHGRNNFWGASKVDDTWVGQNTLGNLWMKLRSELQED